VVPAAGAGRRRAALDALADVPGRDRDPLRRRVLLSGARLRRAVAGGEGVVGERAGGGRGDAAGAGPRGDPVADLAVAVLLVGESAAAEQRGAARGGDS